MHCGEGVQECGVHDVVGINRLYFRGTSKSSRRDVVIVLDYVNSIDTKNTSKKLQYAS